MDAEPKAERSVTPTSQPGGDSSLEDLAASLLKKHGKENQVIRREGSLTLAKVEYNEEEEDKVNPADPLARAIGERPKRSSRYPRKYPVVDPQNNQASVSAGPYDRSLRPPSPVHPEMRVVWTGELTPEVINYLTFCRQLLGKSDIPVSEPLEDDEQALEFLQEHGGNDVERAKLMLIASMGGGAELDSISLELSTTESKTRPSTKGVFRSWVGGEFPKESDGHPDAGNPAKIKTLWKDWAQRCKKALNSSQTTANELFALQKEERRLPRFQSRGSSEEDSLVSSANDASFDLETRLRDIQVFVAQVHDALSLVNPSKRFTVAALKELLDKISKRIQQLKEAELVKEIIVKAENWEKRAARWLTVDLQDEDGSSQASNTQSSQQSNTSRKPSGGSSQGSTRGGQNAANQEFTLAELTELIREGSESRVDHSVSLSALTKRRSDCELLLKRIDLHVPQDKSWRQNQNRKKYDILTLEKLKAFRDELRRTKLKLPQVKILDTHIEAAEDWVAQVHKATTMEKSTIKELTTLLMKADLIPVDLTEEKKVLENFVADAQEWVKRAKAFFPPTRASAIVVGAAGKKTRATAAAEGGMESFQKGNSEDFLTLRDDAVKGGFQNLTEASAAMEAAESVEDWIARVNDTLREEVSEEKLNQLNELLNEAENLPVIVTEERALREAASKMEWSKAALAMIKSAPGSTSLNKMEEHLQEADRQFSEEPTNKRKKARRTIVLENEPELKASVDEAREWIAKATVILQPSASGQKFNSPEEVKAILLTSTHANINSFRRQVIRKVREIGDWQRTVRESLMRTGHFKEDDVNATPTYDVILSEIPNSIGSDDEEEDHAMEDGAEAATNNDSSQPQQTVAAEDVQMDGDDQRTATNTKLEIDVLKTMLYESQRLGVRLPEQEILATIDSKAKDWLSRFSVVSLDVSPTAITSSQSSQISSASKAKSKKRKTGELPLPSPERLELTEQDLHELRDSANDLAVDVSTQVEELDACLEASVEWRQMCQEALENYRTACRNLNSMSYSIPEKDPDLAQPLETSRRGNSMLQVLRLVAFDEKGHERFPSLTEKTCPWWKEEYPDEVRLAVREMVDKMKEAEAKKLHLIALDSAPVRACAWLIQIELWLQKFKSEFASGGPSSSSSKTLSNLCQMFLNGTKLVSDKEFADELPETFPESELAEYAIPPPKSSSTATAPASPSLHAASSSAVSSSHAVPTSKRARMALQQQQQQQSLEQIDAGFDVPPSPSSGAAAAASADNEWRILRYTKELSPNEAEGFDLNMVRPSISGIALRRLFGLRRVIQATLAARGVAKRLPQTPRPERTQARLRQLKAQSASWTDLFQLEKDPRFDYLLSESEAWLEEKKRTLLAKQSSVDQLRKLAERGERVWIDLSQVEMLRKQADLAEAWTKKYETCGLDKGTSTVEELKALLAQGEKIQGVDLQQELETLRKATQVFCMCRGAREDPMIHCNYCSEDFHVECLGKEAFANICPLCLAARAADRQVALGLAAICRLATLDAAMEHPQLEKNLNIVDPERARALCAWVRGVISAVSTAPPASSSRGVIASITANPVSLASVPQPSELINEVPDVKLALQGVAGKEWRVKLETVRHSPPLERLEEFLRQTPPCIPREALRGLQDIRLRAQLATQEFTEVWNSPESEPSENIVERCKILRKKLETVPVDLGNLVRALDECVEDNAQRYCSCNKFNDGKLMVECERCKRWFHGACVGIEGDEYSTEFFCPECRNDQA